MMSSYSVPLIRNQQKAQCKRRQDRNSRMELRIMSCPGKHCTFQLNQEPHIAGRTTVLCVLSLSVEVVSSAFSGRDPLASFMVDNIKRTKDNTFWKYRVQLAYKVV